MSGNNPSTIIHYKKRFHSFRMKAFLFIALWFVKIYSYLYNINQRSINHERKNDFSNYHCNISTRFEHLVLYRWYILYWSIRTIYLHSTSLQLYCIKKKKMIYPKDTLVLNWYWTGLEYHNLCFLHCFLCNEYYR